MKKKNLDLLVLIFSIIFCIFLFFFTKWSYAYANDNLNIGYIIFIYTILYPIDYFALGYGITSLITYLFPAYHISKAIKVISLIIAIAIILIRIGFIVLYYGNLTELIYYQMHYIEYFVKYSGWVAIAGLCVSVMVHSAKNEV